MTRTTFRNLLAGVPWWLHAGAGVALAAIPGVWLVGIVVSPWSTPDEPRLTVAPAADPNTTGGSPAAFDVPARVWTVTLVDELFPERRVKPAPRAEERPTLRAELVAVTGDGPERRAFVRDISADDYLSMSVGDRLDSGATVKRIEAQSIELDYNGTIITLELAK